MLRSFVLTSPIECTYDFHKEKQSTPRLATCLSPARIIVEYKAWERLRVPASDGV